MLEIHNLNVKTKEKELLKNINLTIKDGEIHALMGPNGAGKSTLCKAIMSHPSLTKEGEIIFNDEDITYMSTDEIARKKIFYIEQSPMEIEGVTNAELLRSAMNEMNNKMNIFEFNKECNKYCEKLSIPKSFLHREVNVEMSGGEKKKQELLGMYFLKPKLIIIDEIDSGLDVDAIKIVASNLLEYQKETNCSILIISHQKMLLEYLQPEYIHIMQDNTIKETKDYTFLNEILTKGFSLLHGTNIISEKEKGE